MLQPPGKATLGCSDHVGLVLDTTIATCSCMLITPTNTQAKDTPAGFHLPSDRGSDPDIAAELCHSCRGPRS